LRDAALAAYFVGAGRGNWNFGTCYFVATIEEGSFSEAARVRVHKAQPSLSRQLREIAK